MVIKIIIGEEDHEMKERLCVYVLSAELFMGEQSVAEIRRQFLTGLAIIRQNTSCLSNRKTIKRLCAE